MSAEPALSVALHDADDEVLMARFAAGEAEAFDVLYARYEAPLYGLCVRMLQDGDLADDAFQDAMTSVIERCGVYRERGRFRSWLFTIARNACLDRMRRAVRRRGLVPALLGAGEARAPDPGTALETRDEVARALSVLSMEDREVVLLHRYEGFSYAEIARITSSSEAAVKQRAYRALRSLRAARTT